MKNKGVSLKVSKNQLNQLDDLVEFFESDKGKIIRRGIYLINKYNLDYSEIQDEGSKIEIIRSNFSDEDMKIINKITNEYNIKMQDLIRFSINLQYNILEDLKEYEKKLLTGR
ncbi:hypothetical protein SAMN00017477_0922 [Peptoniphilus asaccharolyticus DSM 20463]|uniref:Uncharacterized protein n=1 Tax=Peptoniphilus asaccharolyticus DSM 20463 TaxID=573058 RepID=A0A1W1UZU8_PEPAS|nr:hypothetical protein [Peptoniphilus asaccharolyticus]MBL7575415.1 hypothetical protein [Peptoniphilus asaccharolyticus]SMB86608.1 hypothetical protein SAMN00017477_0922 [Peptoniphilus asaccharolyticus DSM 20463]